MAEGVRAKRLWEASPTPMAVPTSQRPTEQREIGVGDASHSKPGGRLRTP